MQETYIRAPKFEIGTAMTQVFNLPSSNGYLFRVIGFATLLLTVSLVLFGVPIVKTYVATFESLKALENTGVFTEKFERAVIHAVFAPIGWFFLIYIVQVGTYISVETALYRNIIRGEDKGFFPLRFGMDECKVLVTRIVVALILYVAIIVAYLGVLIIGMAVIGLAMSADPSAAIWVVGVFLILFVLASIGATIFTTVRLAPSAAFSVRDEAFTPVGSWGTMRTYFWPAIGSVLGVGFIGYTALTIFSMLAFGILIYASGIVPVMMELEASTKEVPDFSPVLDTLTSAGFIVPAIFVTLIATFFSFLYMGAIWSVWGYIAKLTDRRAIVDEYG